MKNILTLVSIVMLSGTSESALIQALWSFSWLMVFWYSITEKDA